MNIDLDIVPSNLDQALEIIENGLSQEDIEFIKSHESHEAHFSLGMWLRNNWSLWQEETNLAQWFRKTLGLGHADDMSGIILDSLWRKIRGEPINLDEQVQYYKDYWKEQGIDPLTQERIIMDNYYLNRAEEKYKNVKCPQLRLFEDALIVYSNGKAETLEEWIANRKSMSPRDFHKACTGKYEQGSIGALLHEQTE